MRIIFILLTLLLFANGLLAQDCCNDDNKVTLCYTAADDHCDFSACNYTLDGNNMDGINEKIRNPNNFGLAGTACAIEPIPIGNISSVQEIENLGCEIILLGHFAPDNNAGFGTTLPDVFLSSIREWSQVCEERLVILFQDEAQIWGYEIDDTNANPNVAGNADILNIFDGPFGSLTEFEQGGTFQANFRQLASTGSTILAIDGNGRPTIVLDELTNDIIMADVGIFCEGVGGISESPDIITNNDILACNVMALGCTIASSAWFEEYIDACDDEAYILPNGETVNNSGDYFSYLLSESNCDSTVLTHLTLHAPESGIESYKGCKDDGYSVEFNGTTYDENNPTGVALFMSQIGCDSLVSIELEFSSATASSWDTVICASENYVFNGVLIDRDLDTTLILENYEGCDSLIDVTAEIYAFPISRVESEIEIVNGLPYQFDNEISSELKINWAPDTGLSCTDCPNPEVNLNNEEVEFYTLTLSNQYDCTQSSIVNVSYDCQPYLANTFTPNSSDENKAFGPQVPCLMSEYRFVIYDKWGSVVFESTDQNEKWTGRSSSKPYELGAYVYILSYTNKDRPETIQGMVSLIR